jgi:hypothetical protein
MPKTTEPTLDQLYNLIARAERKGGLNTAEGDRLRAGLQSLVDDNDSADLRRKYANALRLASDWKRRAQANPGTQANPGAPTSPGDQDARDAVRRVTALAQRWLHIPAKRQAATSVFDAITNKDDE